MISYLLYVGLVILTAGDNPGHYDQLKNGVLDSNVYMPIVGLGTCGNGRPNGTGGEYWTDEVAYKATMLWLDAGGKRIDTAIDYHNQVGIGKALFDANVERDGLFLTSKIGPLFSFGYNETLQ